MVLLKIRIQSINKHPIRILQVLFGLILSGVVTACSISGGSGPALEQTLAAQQTLQNFQATIAAQQVQSTMLALQATQLAQQATSLAQQVQSAAGTPAPPSPDTTLTSESVAPETSMPDAELEDRIRSARILLFEDMSGRGQLRYVKEALDEAGYAYTDVGSAQGWFKDNLVSDNEWDLIIAASEARSNVEGEFFDYLLAYIEKGSAFVFETWNVNGLQHGKFRRIMKICGIEYEKDWVDISNRVFFWLEPDHPLFQEPNQLPPPRSTIFWTGDVGDLIKLAPDGGATLLAGTEAGQKTNHGVLTSCLEGRMLLQTFSTHDFDRQDMKKLWQNYIYYTLKNHYLTAP